MMAFIDKNYINECAQKAAKKICVSGCLGNYPDCTRCHEAGCEGFVLAKCPMLGKDKVCPIAKYEVEDQPVPKDCFESMKRQPNIRDCVMLCANCQYGSLNEKELANGYWQVDRTDDDFHIHCRDCPVQKHIKAIEEDEAEASMS